MSTVIRMYFDATETSDGLIHVQNSVMGMLGQHHVHTKANFEKWRNGKSVQLSKGTCDCNMQAGDVREYDGQRWHSE